jgi:hypothetical protein
MNARNREVLFPFLNGEDLNSRPDQSPSRWVINFRDWPIERAREYSDCFRIVEQRVRPERERLGTKDDASAKGYARLWWQFGRKALDLYKTVAGLPRVLCRARVANINSIAFVPTELVFSDAVVVFASAKFGKFALLQSFAHTEWLTSRASTMRTDVRYTPTDCFETFPLPGSTEGLEEIGESYNNRRRDIMLSRKQGLTAIYNRFHDDGDHSEDIEELRRIHVEMDNIVAAAYGWKDLDLSHGFYPVKRSIRFTISDEARRVVLDQLLKLNHERYAAEVAAGKQEKSKKPKKSPKKGTAQVPLDLALDSQ